MQQVVEDRRLRSIKEVARVAGVLLDNGEVWYGKERRGFHGAVSVDKKPLGDAREDNMDPCGFFG